MSRPTRRRARPGSASSLPSVAETSVRSICLKLTGSAPRLQDEREILRLGAATPVVIWRRRRRCRPAATSRCSRCTASTGAGRRGRSRSAARNLGEGRGCLRAGERALPRSYSAFVIVWNTFEPRPLNESSVTPLARFWSMSARMPAESRSLPVTPAGRRVVREVLEEVVVRPVRRQRRWRRGSRRSRRRR